MEDVDAGVRQRQQEPLQFPGRGHQPGGVILLLPLGPAQDDRELRANCCAHRGNDLQREAVAPLQRAAVAVIALVGALPEKLVHQVAVGAVDFHRIKAQCPGIRRALAEGCHYIIDVLLAHDMAVHLAGDVHPGGRVAVHVTLRRRAGLRMPPQCHNWGAILPPSACTASATFFQAARRSAP